MEIDRRKFIQSSGAGVAIVCVESQLNKARALWPINSTELITARDRTVYTSLWKASLRNALSKMKIKDVVLLYESLRDPINASNRLEGTSANREFIEDALEVSGLYPLGAWIVDLKNQYSIASTPDGNSKPNELKIANTPTALHDLCDEIFNRLNLEKQLTIDSFFERYNDTIDNYRNQFFVPAYQETAQTILTSSDTNYFTKLLSSEADRLGDNFEQAIRRLSFGRDLLENHSTYIMEGVSILTDGIKQLEIYENDILTSASNYIQQFEQLPNLIDMIGNDIFKQELFSSADIVGSIIGAVDKRAGMLISQGVQSIVKAHDAVNTILSGGLSIAATGNLVGAALSVGKLLSGLFGGGPSEEEKRQKQIIGALKGVQNSLNVIDRKVDVINNNIVIISKKLDSINANIGIINKKIDYQIKLLKGITENLLDIRKENRERHRELIERIEKISAEIGFQTRLIQGYFSDEIESELRKLRDLTTVTFSKRTKLMTEYDPGSAMGIKFRDALIAYKEFILERSFSNVFRNNDADFRNIETIPLDIDLIEIFRSEGLESYLHLVTSSVDWLKHVAIPWLAPGDLRFANDPLWGSSNSLKFPDPKLWQEATSGYFQLKRIVPEFDYEDFRSLEAFIDRMHNHDMLFRVNRTLPDPLALATDVYGVIVAEIANIIVDQCIKSALPFAERIRNDNDLSRTEKIERLDAYFRRIFGLETVFEKDEYLREGRYHNYYNFGFENAYVDRSNWLDSINLDMETLDDYLSKLQTCLNVIKVLSYARFGDFLDIELSHIVKELNVKFNMADTIENLTDSQVIREYLESETPMLLNRIGINPILRRHDTSAERNEIRRQNRIRANPENILEWEYDFWSIAQDIIDNPVDESVVGVTIHEIEQQTLDFWSSKESDAGQEVLEVRPRIFSEYHHAANIANLSQLAL